MRDSSPGLVQNILDRQNWSLLEPLLPPSREARDQVMARLREYAARVVTWNRSVSNLMSKNDEARIVERHLAESLAPAAWMAGEGVESWLDFGSGAGFPGIPLAIAGVGRQWILVESRRPKVLFMRKTVMDMGLDGSVTVMGSRLEALADQVPQVDGFTARATERLGPTLDIAADFIVSGGRAFLWKGSSWPEELKADESWREKWELVEHRSAGSTNNVIVKFVRT